MNSGTLVAERDDVLGVQIDLERRLDVVPNRNSYEATDLVLVEQTGTCAYFDFFGRNVTSIVFPSLKKPA